MFLYLQKSACVNEYVYFDVTYVFVYHHFRICSFHSIAKSVGPF